MLSKGYPDLTQGEILRHQALTRPMPQDDGVNRGTMTRPMPQDGGVNSGTMTRPTTQDDRNKSGTMTRRTPLRMTGLIGGRAYFLLLSGPISIPLPTSSKLVTVRTRFE